MKLPQIKKEDIGKSLWPNMSYAEVARKLDNGLLSPDERAKLNEYLLDRINALQEYMKVNELSKFEKLIYWDAPTSAHLPKLTKKEAKKIGRVTEYDQEFYISHYEGKFRLEAGHASNDYSSFDIEEVCLLTEEQAKDLVEKFG